MAAKIKKETSNKSLAGESVSSRAASRIDAGTVNADPVGVSYMTYADQIKSPKWQKKRLEIMERDKFACTLCGDKDSELHVHHIQYEKGKNIWDYSDNRLVTLCEGCHRMLHGFNDESILIIWNLVKCHGFIAVNELFNFFSYIIK